MSVPLLTVARMRSLGRELGLPFRVVLQGVDGQDVELACDQLLRLLPEKRVVCRARMGERQVLVKLFIATSAAKRHYLRELNGLQLFEKAGIPTPKLLLHGMLDAGQGFALVTEYIENSSTLLQRWPAADDAQRALWIKATLPLVAQLHKAGAAQQDIHLDNFLMADEIILLIDGDGVSVAPGDKPLSRTQCIDNLALYIAQLECRYDDFVPELLEDYNACHSQPNPVTIAEFLPRLHALRFQRACKYSRKVLRDCSEIRVIKSSRRFLAYRRELDTEAWRRWLSDLDRSVELGDRLKDGNTATVALSEFEGRQLVIKRYNSKGLGHRLSRCLRPTRAAMSWQNGHLLEMAGIDTPQPLAIVEERFGPFRGRAFLVTEYSAAPGVNRYYAPENDDLRVDEVHRQGFESLFRAMRSARISHGDFKASNLLVGNQRVQVIDLDSMVLHRKKQTFERAFERDLQRFLRNWAKGSKLHDQFRALVEKARKVI